MSRDWSLLPCILFTYITYSYRVFKFLKRNLHKCSTSTKATAYISLVWPILEYASSVWDPYQYNKIYIIDRIQRREACWSLCNYDRYSSVTLMQHQLNWKTFKNVRTLLDYHYYTKLLMITLHFRYHLITLWAILIPELITSFHSFILVPEQMSTSTVSTLNYQTLENLSSDMASPQSPALRIPNNYHSN